MHAMVALIKPATPAAALVCPMLALIEPRAAGGASTFAWRRARTNLQLSRVADGSPVP